MEKRWALVTGASRGIGRAIALALAKSGINVYVHFAREKEKANEVVASCLTHGVEAMLVDADFSHSDACQRLVAKLPRKPDILINNAGSPLYGLLTDADPAEIARHIRINLLAPIELTRLVVPHMVRNRFGKIVNIASVWGICGAAMETVYSAANGGLIAFTKALAKELAPNGITVNAVAPGAIDTAMVRNYLAPEILSDLAEQIPLGRLGTVDDVAGVVSFLLSPAADYMTGQVISPNGGWHC
jgi:3-oxoacyl-[acyl-carrier protein] reductase